MRCSFTFGQVEEVLATINNIAADRRGAFQGRLKHLQRANFPTGMKPGKGKALSYTVDHLFMMVLALELIQAGVTPKVASEKVARLWLPIIDTIVTNSYPKRAWDDLRDDPEWYYWVVELEALSDLVEEKTQTDLPTETVRTIAFDLFDETMANGSAYSGRRRLVIHGPALTQEVFRVVTEEKGWASTNDMRADLRASLVERGKLAFSKAPSLEQVKAFGWGEMSDEEAKEFVALGWAKMVDGKPVMTEFGAQTMRLIGGSMLPDKVPPSE